MATVATVGRTIEISGVDSVMELRHQMKRWDAAGLQVQRVQAQGRFKVGPAELEIPAWTNVLDFGQKRIRIEGVPAALPTHATEGSKLRVLVTMTGEVVE